MSGKQFGRYTIKSKLGSGAMATVYRALDTAVQRDVAIKVLHKRLQSEENMRHRFLRESRIIAQLDHPAIVPIYDAGRREGRFYIVMRLMEGGNLDDRIQQGALPVDEVVMIITRMCTALDAAHKMKIVHRDIKPENILFDHYGQPFLADFGIVKLAASNTDITGDTLIGTPAYMSPEQVSGTGDLDGRSDIYSLGIVLFEMLTGEIPFKADTTIRMAMQHVSAPIPVITNVNDKVPLVWQKVINRALAKNKQKRFQTGAQLAAAVRTAAQKQARKQTGKSVPLVLPNRIKRILATVILFALLAVGLILVWSWLANNNGVLESDAPLVTQELQEGDGVITKTDPAETAVVQQPQQVTATAQALADASMTEEANTATAVALQIANNLTATQTSLESDATHAAATAQAEATHQAEATICQRSEGYAVEVLGAPVLEPDPPYYHLQGTYPPEISATWLVANIGQCPLQNIRLNSLTNLDSLPVKIWAGGQLLNELALHQTAEISLKFAQAQDARRVDDEWVFVVESESGDVTLIELPHLTLQTDNWVIIVVPTYTPTALPIHQPTTPPEEPSKPEPDNPNPTSPPPTSPAQPTSPPPPPAPTPPPATAPSSQAANIAP